MKVLKGINDLNTTNPELAKQWHPTKNSFKPTEVTAGSGKKAWWICPICGFEWKAEISSRNKGRGCPRCANATSSSFPEQTLYYYLSNTFESVENRNKDFGIELDIYIPSEKVAIEYDGYYWHKDKMEDDNEKDALCLENGVKLIRIREKGLKNTNYAINIERNHKEDLEELSNIVVRVFNIIGYPSPDVNVKRDQSSIISSYICELKGKSLSALYPEISKEWHPTLNGALKPEMVLSGSHTKVWWKCSSCGYEWETTVKKRCDGRNCPRCANNVRSESIILKKAHYGINTLSDNYPLIAEEWHPSKNGELTPDKIASHSGEKVWWLGKCGHEWEASVDVRVNGAKCPYCSGRRVLYGFNDLTTTNPELMDEWDYSKNTINPKEIKAGSHHKVWWKCSVCGKEWETEVRYRAKGHGCPVCNKKTSINTNLNLKRDFQAIIREISPDIEVGEYINSSTKVNCKCKVCNYEWKSRPHSLLRGSGCPNCSSNLKLTNEEFIKRVKGVSPDISIQSEYNGRREKVKCKCLICNNEWEANAGSLLDGRGCPNYRMHSGWNGNKKTNEEFINDLLIKNPQITVVGNYVNARTKVECKCKVCGFEWSASPNNLLNGYGCPNYRKHKKKNYNE